MKMTPIILSGGSGTRLWPVSTEKNSSQNNLKISKVLYELDAALKTATAKAYKGSLFLFRIQPKTSEISFGCIQTSGADKKSTKVYRN